MRENAKLFESHMTYTVYGAAYCRLRRNGKPKRLYATLKAAQEASDLALSSNTMLWEFKHFDHWHLTGMAPLLIRALPPAIRMKDGPGSKKSQNRHLIPYLKRRKFSRGYSGHHFIRAQEYASGAKQ
jgi:hypothetical protein